MTLIIICTCTAMFAQSTAVFMHTVIMIVAYFI